MRKCIGLAEKSLHKSNFRIEDDCCQFWFLFSAVSCLVSTTLVCSSSKKKIMLLLFIKDIKHQQLQWQRAWIEFNVFHFICYVANKNYSKTCKYSTFILNTSSISRSLMPPHKTFFNSTYRQFDGSQGNTQNKNNFSSKKMSLSALKLKYWWIFIRSSIDSQRGRRRRRQRWWVSSERVSDVG